MAQKIREVATFLGANDLENLKDTSRGLAVEIDYDSSAVKSGAYADIFEDRVPETIRYIELLEKRIDQIEGTPTCKDFRDTADFFNDNQLSDIQKECREITVDIQWDGSAVKASRVKDYFTEHIPKLITYARLLEKHLDQYKDQIEQLDRGEEILNRLRNNEARCEELERRYNELQRQLDALQGAGKKRRRQL